MILVRASVSIHLVESLKATTRYFTCSATLGKGPSRSIPHHVNGHGEESVVVKNPTYSLNVPMPFAFVYYKCPSGTPAQVKVS